MLEDYVGPGETSTDDDIMASSTRRQLRSSQGCAADSGINLKFSSASQASSLFSFNRQVLSYLRKLEANLNYLKVINIQHELLYLLTVLILLPDLTMSRFCLRRWRPSIII